MILQTKVYKHNSIFIIMKKRLSEKLYKEEIKKLANQQAVWNSIAKSWNQFRQKPFPEIVEKCAVAWPKGKVLDIGCGNCRNLIPFAKRGFECYALDFSKDMLKTAKELCRKNAIRINLNHGRAEELPFASNSFDYCISIASLHHIDDFDTRKKAILEMCRVLKSGGKALITVWNKLQLRFLFKPKHHYVTWNTNGKPYFRYYYLFNYLEIRELIEKCGFNILYTSGPLGRNLIFVIQKP